MNEGGVNSAAGGSECQLCDGCDSAERDYDEYLLNVRGAKNEMLLVIHVFLKCSADLHRVTRKKKHFNPLIEHSALSP